jgi:serine/threonine protein phosphatase PrpC
MTNATAPPSVGVTNESTSTEYGSYSIDELFPPVDAIKTQPIQMENLPLEQIPIQQPTIIVNDDALRIYDHGVHRAQGARSHQEDRYVLLDQMNTSGFAFFGVYDGHHNELFSSHASKHLHNHILESVEFTNGNIHEAIRTGFYLEDKQTFDELVNRKRELLGGSTAAIALLMANQRELWVGNAGDSRVVLAQKSAQYGKAADDKTWYDAIRLSHDHKPTDPEEMERITSSGGSVTKGRVENAINMSRALGDHTFKVRF